MNEAGCQRRASAHAAAGRFVQDAGEARHHHRCALAALAVLPDTPANRRARVDVTLRLIGSSRAAESPAHNLALLSAAEVLLRGIAPENAVPGDPRSPFVTSGLRIGTAAITTRSGMAAAVLGRMRVGLARKAYSSGASKMPAVTVRE